MGAIGNQSMKIPSVEIRRTVWGNWWGYVGGKREHEIGASDYDAKYWLREKAAELAREATK